MAVYISIETYMLMDFRTFDATHLFDEILVGAAHNQPLGCCSLTAKWNG